MVKRNLLAAFGVAATVLVGGVSQPAKAEANFTRLTFLTFSQPVRLPGVTLGSGTYIFELADPGGAPEVVRVLSRDRQIAYYMGFTRPIERKDRQHLVAGVSMAESAPGQVSAVTVWWPEGEAVGHQFIYSER